MTLQSLADVHTFVRFVIVDRNVNFHPDDDFADYVTPAGQPTFTTAEADHLNGLLAEAQAICEAAGSDLSGIALPILRERVGAMLGAQ